MPSTNGNPTTDQWLTINEIANWYGESTSSIRLKLKKKLDGMKKPEVESVCQPGAGRAGHRYCIDFVKGVLGLRPSQHSTGAQRDIFNKPRHPSTRIVGPKAESLLIGILESRMRANEAYNSLLTEMISFGQGLRIRCITGTDFFNSHLPTAEAFFKRAKNKNGLDPAKVLLLYPFGHGAGVRCAAEVEPRLEKSQLRRDATSTYGFVSVYAQQLKLDAKWVDGLPTSLLVWTEDYALIEPYDHGRQDGDRSGCIGRQAPIMVVSADATYHTVLKNGFDYVFDGKEEETRIKTFSLEEVGTAFTK